MKRTTSDDDVALRRIVDVSNISTINVDCPSKMLSEAPILVKIASAGDIRNDCAGTNEPIWAKMVA